MKSTKQQNQEPKSTWTFGNSSMPQSKLATLAWVAIPLIIVALVAAAMWPG